MSDQTTTKTAEEIAAIELLERLGEYQAQSDYLMLKKQELLDTVHIPQEVIAAQDEANKRRQAIDANFWKQQSSLIESSKILLAEIVDPPMPPEFVLALAAARHAREEIEAETVAMIDQERKATNQLKDRLDAELQAKTGEIYAQVATRKAEIATEFDDKASGVLDNIAKLTAEIKNAVKAEQKTIKGKFYQAVYVKGRVTWITDMLDGMIVAFPALAKARKEGEPSVTLRRI